MSNENEIPESPRVRAGAHHGHAATGEAPESKRRRPVVQAPGSRTELRLESGSLVDRFRIIKSLGAGGMGEVYFALDTERFINVALKVLRRSHPHYSSLSKRFRIEADVYRKIAHPNIVGFIASGTFQDIDYIALEHIRGRSLLDLLAEKGVLPLDEALSYGVDLIYAVNAAHQKDVIHRDIKPHNVMITNDGVAKLIDFGVAKETDVLLQAGMDRSVHVDELQSGDGSPSGGTLGVSSSGGSTGTGQVVGTLVYCSPEQLQCQRIDGRSDIYSLGLVFYELLTGMRPVAGHTATDILLNQSKLDSRIVPPSTIQPAVDPRLDKMVLKMIRYDPDERYQSSIELIEEVRRLGLAESSAEEDSTERRKAQRRSKHLAKLELSDTYYWKALDLIERKHYKRALDEFHKLLHTNTELPARLGETISEHIDYLFWTKYPIVPTLPGELPSEYLSDRLEFIDYVRLLIVIVQLYLHLERPVSAALALTSLENARLQASEERPDVYGQVAELIDACSEDPCFQKVREHIQSLETTTCCEDLRASTETSSSLDTGYAGGTGVAAGDGGTSGTDGAGDQDCNGPDKSCETAPPEGENDDQTVSSPEEAQLAELQRKALYLCTTGNAKAALEQVKKILALRPYDREALGMAVFALAERGIRIPSYVDRNSTLLEIYLLLGMFHASADEIKKGLHNDVSDLAQYQKIINLYRRAGLEEELWRIYFAMAELLVDQDCPDRVKRLVVKSVEQSPGNRELIEKIRNLKNLHKIFSIQELSAIGVTSASPGRDVHSLS